MYNLGILENDQGNTDKARSWYERAIATDHPDDTPRAMLNLGILEKNQGNTDEARRWWEGAVATGHHDAVTVQARHLLGDLERGEEERRHAEHFGRYGWQAYADPQLMKRGGSLWVPKTCATLYSVRPLRMTLLC